MANSHTTLHVRLADQTTPEDPCTVPIAFLGLAFQGGDQAFYEANCTSPPAQLTPSGSQSADYLAMAPGGQDVIAALEDTPNNSTGAATHLVEVNIQTLSK